jgi:hypothetical protein
MAEMATKLELVAMHIAAQDTSIPWHNMGKDERNRWREIARVTLVECQDYLKSVWERN